MDHHERLLLALKLKLERVLQQLQGVKSSDATVQAWGRVLDARCEISTTLGMLQARLKEHA